jgi:hypothetical protein
MDTARRPAEARIKAFTDPWLGDMCILDLGSQQASIVFFFFWILGQGKGKICASILRSSNSRLVAATATARKQRGFSSNTLTIRKVG